MSIKARKMNSDKLNAATSSVFSIILNVVYIFDYF